MATTGRVKVGRNEPCPCGTGRKYKQCCIDRGFTWMRDQNGEIIRQLPMTDELRDVIQEQTQRFREKFGRDPGPEDKLFFDAPEPEHLEAEMVSRMREVGIHPRIIYAYEKTGLLRSEENEHLISTRDRELWDAACDEYDRLIGDA